VDIDNIQKILTLIGTILIIIWTALQISNFISIKVKAKKVKPKKILLFKLAGTSLLLLVSGKIFYNAYFVDFSTAVLVFLILFNSALIGTTLTINHLERNKEQEKKP